MGNGQVLGTDPVPTFLLRVLEALNCLKTKNRRGSSSIKDIAEFVNSSYRHFSGDIVSQVQMSLNKAVRQGMVKQDKRNKYYLVPPVIQFMETCLPRSAAMNDALPIDNSQTKNCLEKMGTGLDTGPMKCKKCGNYKCNCRIGCGCPSNCKECQIKTKLKTTGHRRKATNIRICNKYRNKKKTGVVYAKIVKCPECFRILSMKKV